MSQHAQATPVPSEVWEALRAYEEEREAIGEGSLSDYPDVCLFCDVMSDGEAPGNVYEVALQWLLENRQAYFFGLRAGFIEKGTPSLALAACPPEADDEPTAADDLLAGSGGLLHIGDLDDASGGSPDFGFVS